MQVLGIGINYYGMEAGSSLAAFPTTDFRLVLLPCLSPSEAPSPKSQKAERRNREDQVRPSVRKENLMESCRWPEPCTSLLQAGHSMGSGVASPQCPTGVGWGRTREHPLAPSSAVGRSWKCQREDGEA